MLAVLNIYIYIYRNSEKDSESQRVRESDERDKDSKGRNKKKTSYGDIESHVEKKRRVVFKAGVKKKKKGCVIDKERRIER